MCKKRASLDCCFLIRDEKKRQLLVVPRANLCNFIINRKNHATLLKFSPVSSNLLTDKKIQTNRLRCAQGGKCKKVTTVGGSPSSHSPGWTPAKKQLRRSHRRSIRPILQRKFPFFLYLPKLWLFIFGTKKSMVWVGPGIGKQTPDENYLGEPFTVIFSFSKGT